MRDKWINGIYVHVYVVGRGSSVGIATRYGLEGSNPGGERFSAPIQMGPGAHTASYTMGTRSSWGVALTIHPHLAPRLKKEQGYTSNPPVGLRGLF